MQTRRTFKTAWIVILATPVMTLIIPGWADAAFTVTLTQVGRDVVATGVGSLDLTGVTDLGTSSIYGGQIQATFGLLKIGATDFERVYRPYFSTTAGFGSDVYRTSTLGTGFHVGIYTSSSLLLTSTGYVSGTQFTSTSTFAGTTIAELGLTVGTYTYTYSATQGGPTLDTFTIQVGNSGTVPEPSSVLMCSIAALTGIAFRTVQRRRTR